MPSPGPPGPPGPPDTPDTPDTRRTRDALRRLDDAADPGEDRKAPDATQGAAARGFRRAARERDPRSPAEGEPERRRADVPEAREAEGDPPDRRGDEPGAR